MRRVAPVLQLLALLLAEAGAVAALHRLGGVRWLALPRGSWSSWLATSAPADVLVAVLRLVALGFAWWLFVSTALYVTARLARLPRGLAAAGWGTLPAVRRVVDRTLAVALTASATLPGGAAAFALDAAPPPVPVEIRESGPTAELPMPPGAVRPLPVPEPGAVRPLPVPEPGAAPLPPAVAQPPEPPAPTAVAGEHRILAGEHLWGIAAEALAAAGASGHPEAAGVSRRDVHAYWRALIEANVGRLRSGDPELVYPGEVVVLPPLPPAG